MSLIQVTSGSNPLPLILNTDEIVGINLVAPTKLIILCRSVDPVRREPITFTLSQPADIAYAVALFQGLCVPPAPAILVPLGGTTTTAAPPVASPTVTK